MSWFDRLQPQRFGTRLIILTLCAVLIPVAFFVVAFVFHNRSFVGQIDRGVDKIEKQTQIRIDRVIRNMAETSIREKAEDVALQLDIYLSQHRDLTLRDLQNSMEFRRLAVQPFGISGYTAVHDLTTGAVRFHLNAEIENQDLKDYARPLPGFMSILEEARLQKRSGGYYAWKDFDDEVYTKFMYVIALNTPTADGIRLSVASTSYLDEYSEPVHLTQEAFEEMTKSLTGTINAFTRGFLKLSLILLVGAGVLLFFFAYGMGRYFSRTIDSLREATGRVNKGEFNVSVRSPVKGDLGALVTDFNNMFVRLGQTTVSKQRLEESEVKLRITNDELMKEIEVRQHAEAALRISEQKYRNLFEYSKDAIMILDEDGFKDCNQATLDIYGCKTKEEFVSCHPADLSPPFQPSGKESRGESLSQIENALKNGFSSFNWVHKRTDGTLFPCEVLLGRFEMEGKEMVQAAVRDITERVKSEETIRESENRFRLLAESTPLGIAVLNPELKFEYFNPRFTEIFGYTPEDLPDWRIWSEKAYPDPAYRNEFEMFYRGEVMVNPEAGRVHQRVLNTFCKIGGEKIIHFRAVIMPNHHHLLTFEDITEYRQMEIQLREAQKMEAIGTLAGGIAHDFNNLLMGIQGYASLMMLEIDQQHPFYNNLEAIEKQVRSGADLTRQLLGYARGGRYEVRPTDLNELIEQTLGLFSRTRKELNIHRSYGSALWVTDVDRTQIEQVLLNLFLNAWQAMPGGGDLYLETTNILFDEKEASDIDLVPGSYVRIIIRDTGVGMDEWTRQRIFEPFFTTKEMGRGTGLGLATVYGIIKGHGGFIEVRSERGSGSVFLVYLPASQESLEEEKLRPTQELKKGRETILLIDDEEVVLIVTRRILRMLGYGVITASSGPGAIELYRSRCDEIALVILDMIMPGMSGCEVFDRLKRINSEVKVILSSGYSLEGQAQDIIDQGALAFIQKPFSASKLSEKIREVLERPETDGG
ncbi:MAG: PAS domain S-box protein [Syntrophales bacterium]|nr:PAS domain S-box protein [Syntrophales bacterium]